MLGAAMEVITQFQSLVRLDRCLYISGTNLKANLRSSRCDAIARDCRTVRGELLVRLIRFDAAMLAWLAGIAAASTAWILDFMVVGISSEKHSFSPRMAAGDGYTRWQPPCGHHAAIMRPSYGHHVLSPGAT